MKSLKEILKAPGAVTAAIPRHPPQSAARFERVTLEQLDTTHHRMVAVAVKAARQWAIRRETEPGASLVLIASPVGNDDSRTGYGCGKTHIARACLHTDCFWLDDAPAAAIGQFFDANAIIQRLDAVTPARIVIRGAKIVVVDDVGAEQTIPYTVGADQAAERQQRYFKLFDFCYQNNVSMILTGNLTINGLAERIGGRAWSRLQELSPRGFILDLTGVPDWRRRQR